MENKQSNDEDSLSDSSDLDKDMKNKQLSND